MSVGDAERTPPVIHFNGLAAHLLRRSILVRRVALGAVFLSLLAIAPLAVAPFWQFMFTQALIYALAALSVNVLFGQAGMIALYPATFLGIGAYSANIIHNRVSSWVAALLVAVAVSAIIGGVLGASGTRLRGMIFGIVTFAFALAMDSLVFRHGILEIPAGLGASMNRPDAFGVNFFNDQNFYYVVLVVGVLTWLLVAAHEWTRPGRAWRAIRDNEAAALAIGIRVFGYRIWAAALGGAVAGAAGVLFVTLHGQTNVESFTPVQSLLIFTAAMTGGTRSPIGAVIAGALLILLPQLFSDWGISGNIVPIIFAIGVLLSLQGSYGIAGSLQAPRVQLQLAAARLVRLATRQPGTR
jgi:branched-chain amino acid transport system permease protein